MERARPQTAFAPGTARRPDICAFSDSDKELRDKYDHPMFHYVESFLPIEVQVQVADSKVAGVQAHIEYNRKRMKARARLPPQQRYGYIIQHHDSSLRPAGAAERKLIADWLAQDTELHRAVLLGTGFVLGSALVRGALTAVLWLVATPMPYHVHASVDEAAALAVKEFGAAGIRLPESLSRNGSPRVQGEVDGVLASRGITHAAR